MIHELFAYLCVNDSAKAIAFYASAFGATEKFRLTEPSGRIGHAELDFNGRTLMLSDEFPEYNIRGPAAFGGTAVTIQLKCCAQHFSCNAEFNVTRSPASETPLPLHS
jgi:PhnB protein